MSILTENGMQVPHAKQAWTCVKGKGIVNLEFDPRQGYRVLTGSIMAGEVSSAYEEFRKGGIAAGLFEPRSDDGTWRLNENILMNSPVDAASMFLGKEFQSATCTDIDGVEIQLSDLPPSRRWSPEQSRKTT